MDKFVFNCSENNWNAISLTDDAVCPIPKIMVSPVVYQSIHIDYQ